MFCRITFIFVGAVKVGIEVMVIGTEGCISSVCVAIEILLSHVFLGFSLIISSGGISFSSSINNCYNIGKTSSCKGFIAENLLKLHHSYNLKTKVLVILLGSPGLMLMKSIFICFSYHANMNTGFCTFSSRFIISLTASLP